MKISDLQHEYVDGNSRVSALVGDERIWYEVNTPVEPANFGDVFLTAALFCAMDKHEDLELPDNLPVSKALIDSLDKFQTIYQFWYPRLSLIKITARVRTEDAAHNDNVGSFFSGGADSSFSFIKHQDEISHLIFIHGLDMQLENVELFEKVVAANNNFARKFGKKLVVVKTNIRKYPTNRGLSWLICQGGGLASVAHLLGFHKTYIPATHTYAELFPWGSHPLTDHLLQSKAVKLKHDGAEARRSDKIRRIASVPEALKLLRVCWQDRGYNCGECEKCLRTMLILKILNISSEALPPLNDLSKIKKLQLHGDSEYTYVQDSLLLAEEVGHEEIVGFLKKLERKIMLRRTFVLIEKTFFGGRIKSLFYKK